AGLKVNNYNNWDEKLPIKLERILRPLQLSFTKIDEKYFVIRKIEENNMTKASSASPSNISINTKVNNSQIIKGYVIDENNQPAIGVTVQVKGTQIGTNTDLDGYFELSTSSNSILIFSFIGYKTIEIPLQGKNEIKLTLEVEATRMDEVVVVAYGIQKKTHLTGSVATLNTAELAQKPIDNLTNMLAGRLPGVITRQQSGVPGENAAKFFVRGRSSPTGSGAPLIIVDGVERAFDNLDPNEIETITI
ncbi:MAG TPA: carboxypeptidase-like regulatory domain-containing protein, partial [Saprospiraceae bacterium]|nr:carboxypeptidase-like regulatory domain-containing protein [Saprospiraceae bacterium]